MWLLIHAGIKVKLAKGAYGGRYDMAWTEPMRHNKPNITYLHTPHSSDNMPFGKYINSSVICFCHIAEAVSLTTTDSGIGFIHKWAGLLEEPLNCCVM